ncbi:queuine tRNA-ribosyltransferase accessory subunit 2-like isoform X2 [Ostrea edulis]|uniref:queuine tRNA-ribosyltransferase accessory subunit 2-like isoform X2 n=1 Tax=Ostrea edulis TaxID=37623 RepID=UPI0024AF0700|nr:queuine tRNA-ribosyltransferase accessory subunit 2-like isoform X2 [Ostrea edulis]
MRFTLKSVTQCGCRLGTLSCQREVTNGENTHIIETPVCMLYTKKGSAPWLSIDMLKRIEKLPPIAHMHLSSLSDLSEAVEKFQQGIAKFTSMQDFLVYISVHDSGLEIPSGYNTKAGTAVWNKAGKKLVDPQLFIKCQEAFHPSFYQALSDADTDRKSGKKRAMKAVDRTLNFLDTILELHKKSQRLRDVGVFGSIEGGFYEEERKRSAKETAARDVDGFVIEGFHAQDEKNETFDVEEMKDLCKIVFENLPKGKPRLMHAVWSPDQVVMAMELGIDIFDSCYPWLVTERGGALVFSFDFDKTPQNEKDAGSSEGFEISLNDKRLFLVFPLVFCLVSNIKPFFVLLFHPFSRCVQAIGVDFVVSL